MPQVPDTGTLTQDSDATSPWVLDEELDTAVDTALEESFEEAFDEALGEELDDAIDDAFDENFETAFDAALADADLASKPADETITGDWAFTGAVTLPTGTVTSANLVSVQGAKLVDGTVTYAKTDGSMIRKATNESITARHKIEPSGTWDGMEGESGWGTTTRRLAIGGPLESNPGGAAAESAVSIFAEVPLLDPAPPSYEKMALYIRARTHDTIQPGYGTVGIDVRGEIADDNPDGSVWGLYAEGKIESGGEGTCKGAEISVHNEGGSDNATLAGNTKVALALTAQTTPISAALWIVAGNLQTEMFHHGIAVNQEDLAAESGDTFLNIYDGTVDVPIFNVLRTGQIGVGVRPISTIGCYLKDYQFRTDRDSGLSTGYGNRVTGDDFARWQSLASGQLSWGSGSIALDTHLRREDPAVLGIGGTNPALQLPEVTAAPDASADTARIYAIDNGSGKTQLKVRFGTGSAVTIATEP